MLCYCNNKALLSLQIEKTTLLTLAGVSLTLGKRGDSFESKHLFHGIRALFILSYLNIFQQNLYHPFNDIATEVASIQYRYAVDEYLQH